MKSKLLVILPVYNEGKSIYDLLTEYDRLIFHINNMPHKIIVVNDCSTDDSSAWIEKACNEKSLNVELINHPDNRNLGGALRSGFNLLKTEINPDDYVVTMDGDNTHNPFLIKDMMEKINQGADIVIASRFREQSRISGLSAFRKFLSFGVRVIYSLLWRIPGVKDYTCGYRMYKGECLLHVMDHFQDNFIEENGFASTAEVLRKTAKFVKIVVEVPLILRYEKKYEQSNMDIMKTIRTTLLMIGKSLVKR